ncbi:MAG TPA: zinc ribbon domain-containing protein [Solirubrobacterales bacterium]
MYCSRCGTQNEPGDRFCSSCGTALQSSDGDDKPKRSPRKRLGSLIGDSRKAKLTTLGTLAALAVAVVAFIVLKPSDHGETEIPRDAYTITADNMCIAAKQRIVAVERQALATQSGADTGLEQLVPVVAAWRGEFEAMRVPTDRVERARHVSEALRQVEIQLSGLDLSAANGEASGALSSAKKVDAASAEVEKAIFELGLTHCASKTIEFGGESRN